MAEREDPTLLRTYALVQGDDEDARRVFLEALKQSPVMQEYLRQRVFRALERRAFQPPPAWTVIA